ncbi:TolB family protein [Portibacter marinus]|uniref:TolB family protein n=1 Tax=Portibacter marinus TaxID=2898660 RepID=UPI001F3D3D33|nr:hypothetical protein [Portibacter marinus]
MIRIYIFLFLIWKISANAQTGIAYLSNESGNFDIYWMSIDGSQKLQLTRNEGWDWSPKWNSKLQAFIFNSTDTSGNFEIRSVDLAGYIDSLNTFGKEEFILSPDGTKFLYTLKDGNNRYIGLTDIQSGRNRLLVAHPSYNGRPDWSPDGTKFSFISDREGNNELYFYDLEAQNTIRLTTSEKSEKYTSWMPDSKQLVYTYHYSEERDKESNDIFMIDLYTKEINQITNDSKFYQEISVSPDGQKIAFHAKRMGKDHIYVMDLDGSNEAKLTTVDAYHGEPAWSDTKGN